MPLSPQYNSIPSRTKSESFDILCNNRGTMIKNIYEGIENSMSLFELSDSSFDLDDLNIDTPKIASSQGERQSVTFPLHPVIDIWERPATLPEEKGGLYYTAEEIWRFRIEYRTESIMNRLGLENGGEEIVEVLSNRLQGVSEGLTTENNPIKVRKKLPPPQPRPQQKVHSIETMTAIDTMYLF